MNSLADMLDALLHGQQIQFWLSIATIILLVVAICYLASIHRKT